MTDTVLVVGASGVVGTTALERFLERGYQAIAVSRRVPEAETDRRHLALDLTDTGACRDAVAGMGAVTHVAYAAVAERPGPVAGWRSPEQMQLNLAMLGNLLDPLCASAPVRHISLLQGTKAYGAHLHPILVPARERQPRDDHENLYRLHEVLLDSGMVHQ